mmetsp:Transcript_68559/g.121285  ORF Transcript_68559/g.121285 Transcript_68559/m.121285 type:complete len:94 (-) Transcript_68559:257-538(-)
MPNWLRDRLTMLNATTLHQAVDITRKAVAGVTIAYHPGSSGHGNTPMPHSPTPMEINALRGTHAAGPRRRGRSHFSPCSVPTCWLVNIHMMHP